MIDDDGSHTNIWLGEGDVGLAVVVDQEGQARGIGCYQLKEKHDIGSDITINDRVEGSKGINILFANNEGIMSLYKVMAQFINKLIEENREE